jgi:hypothetical protein
MQMHCKVGKVSVTPACSPCRVPVASTRVNGGAGMGGGEGERKTVTLSVLAYAISSRLPL